MSTHVGGTQAHGWGKLCLIPDHIQGVLCKSKKTSPTFLYNSKLFFKVVVSTGKTNSSDAWEFTFIVNTEIALQIVLQRRTRPGGWQDWLHNFQLWSKPSGLGSTAQRFLTVVTVLWDEPCPIPYSRRGVKALPFHSNEGQLWWDILTVEYSAVSLETVFWGGFTAWLFQFPNIASSPSFL